MLAFYTSVHYSIIFVSTDGSLERYGNRCRASRDEACLFFDFLAFLVGDRGGHFDSRRPEHGSLLSVEHDVCVVHARTLLVNSDPG
jgi:hypothetical protein